MTDYRQTPLEGSSRVRARVLHFVNPLVGLPSVWIEEERVLAVGDQLVTIDCAGPMNSGELPVINQPVADMTLEFPLRDVASGDLLEGQTATYGQVYALLFSLYWHLAEARDAAMTA